jgi:hypothetical protein
MFFFIGLRTTPRLASPALFASRPRALFVSHFQTRSFLTTPRLGAAASKETSKSSPKPKSQTTSTPAAKKRVTREQTATKKETAANEKKKPGRPVNKDEPEKGVSVCHFFVYLFSHFHLSGHPFHHSTTS